MFFGLFYFRGRSVGHELETTNFMLAYCIQALAYGNQAVATSVQNDGGAVGEEGTIRVLTSAETRKRRIPLRKEKYAPNGENPNQCYAEARCALDATIEEGRRWV